MGRLFNMRAGTLWLRQVYFGDGVGDDGCGCCW